MSDFSGAATFDDDDLRQLIDGNVVTAEDVAAQEEAGELVGQWVPLTLADAYKNVEPTQFLIDGVLPIPSLSIIYGGPGSLKSMVLTDMALCVAAGKTWLDPLPGDANNIPGVTFTTHQAPAMWIDFDNGPRRTSERVGALGRGHNLPPDTPFQYLSLPSPWLDASDPTQVREVAKWAKHHKSKLIIIDNLSLISGDTDENSGQMSQVLSKLRWLSEETQSAVIIIHHQRKSSGTMANSAPKSETLRGHSSINAMLDMALLVERNGREDAVLITPTKVRDYQDFESFGALWTFEHVPGTKQLASGRFWSKPVANTEEAINIAIRAHIKNELRGKGWMAAKVIRDLVRDRMAAKPGGKAPGVNKVNGLMREMAEDGTIRRQGGTRDLEYALL